MEFNDFALFGTNRGFFAEGRGLLGRASSFDKGVLDLRNIFTQSVAELPVSFAYFRRLVAHRNIPHDLVGAIVPVNDNKGGRAGFLAAAVLFPEGTTDSDCFSVASQQSLGVLTQIRDTLFDEQMRLSDGFDPAVFLPDNHGSPYNELDLIANERMVVYGHDPYEQVDPVEGIHLLTRLKRYQDALILVTNNPLGQVQEMSYDTLVKIESEVEQEQAIRAAIEQQRRDQEEEARASQQRERELEQQQSARQQHQKQNAQSGDLLARVSALEHQSQQMGQEIRRLQGALVSSKQNGAYQDSPYDEPKDHFAFSQQFEDEGLLGRFRRDGSITGIAGIWDVYRWIILGGLSVFICAFLVVAYLMISGIIGSGSSRNMPVSSLEQATTQIGTPPIIGTNPALTEVRDSQSEQIPNCQILDVVHQNIQEETPILSFLAYQNCLTQLKNDPNNSSCTDSPRWQNAQQILTGSGFKSTAILQITSEDLFQCSTGR